MHCLYYYAIFKYMKNFVFVINISKKFHIEERKYEEIDLGTVNHLSDVIYGTFDTIEYLNYRSF